MASATSERLDGVELLADSSAARVFHWLVAGLTIVGFCVRFMLLPSPIDALELSIWVLASLLADLMSVRFGKGIILSMSLPVLLAAGFLHGPAVTGLIAFLGCLDPREIRGECSIERILFNRAQIGLSAAAASYSMHLFSGGTSDWPVVLVVFALGLCTDCIVNVAFVAISTVLSGRAGWRDVIPALWGAEPIPSLGLYLTMCLIAPLLLLIYEDWGPWALLACTAILLPFRIALTNIERLSRTKQAVRVREAAVASAQDLVRAQRHEERLLIAGDLHDEVLPALFKVHLMGEVLKQDLANGRLLDLDDDLPDLLDATSAAQRAVRDVVGGLRTRDSIGDIGRAIEACIQQLDLGDGLEIRPQVCNVDVSEEVAVVILQVVREAVVNSSRYADARVVRIDLAERPNNWAELSIVDDGTGFDPQAVDVREHFGLQLMRERVLAIGGRLEILSGPSWGTVVSATIPRGRTRPRT